MNFKESKSRVRDEVRQKHKHFPEKHLLDCSTGIIEKIEALNAFKEANLLLAYWPLRDEVQIEPLIERWVNLKKILLPVIEGSSLKLKLYEGRETMVTNSLYGIKEPTGNFFANLHQIDLALVPGVAFDPEGYRVGRGKGYYDRLLPRLTNAIKVGVCFNFQVFEKVPRELHDQKLDLLVTG